MTKSDFKLIMDSIDARIAGCSEHLDHVHTTDDIKQLTIQQAIDLKQFCLDEESIMTKIAMVDLYHIIGMGDLTPVQMSQFTFKMKTYLAYRPNIKAIANKLDSINDLPIIPAATKFRLLGLCNLTLHSEFDDEEVADVSDYDELKFDSSKVAGSDKSFSLSGNEITIYLSYVDQFVATYKAIFKTNISKNNLLQKIKGNHSYAGIKWYTHNAATAAGIIDANLLDRKSVV